MSGLRKILFPLSLIYEFVIRLRNLLYDNGTLESHKFNTPSICLGNLNVGGSGKTPFISFLVHHFQTDRNIAILSRGYKRKTKGFKEVFVQDKATDVGDEPLQFKLQFPNVTVVVDEKRAHGMHILESSYQPDLILLDDAFQHRAVKADINIVLTMYQKPFYKDFLLPAGNLREPASSAQRANIIIVTKTPKNITSREIHIMKNKLQTFDDQPVFFSGIVYSNSIIGKKKELSLTQFENFSLVTGIAHPQPLVDFLHEKDKIFKHLKFPDHHAFSDKELEQIRKAQPILTTQKDFMRLKTVQGLEAIYYLPIAFEVLQEEDAFFKLLNDRLKTQVH